jgi:hypothetical protein
MMQSDYTRKTQEVAEHRRAVEAERETIAKSAEFQKAHAREIGTIAVFDEQLEAYQKLDWATFRANNPDAANAAFQDYVQLRDRRDQLATKINQDLQKRTLDEQQSFARRVEEGQRVLQREIPNWGPETASKLVGFAKENGLSDADINRFQDNPKMVKLLHSAWLGEQLVAKQKAAASKAVAAKPAETAEVKPLTQVARKPSGAAKPGLHDELSPEEWTRRRNEQIRKRG